MNTNQTPRYLRLSLLSACNLRCSYCLPSGQIRPAIMASDDMVRSAIRFLYDSGIRKIRFTGGEPTLYKGLSELISFVKMLDVDIHTAVTSNGVLLKTKAKELEGAGLDSMNISLDTIDPSKFRSLTGRDLLADVISGIDAAAEYIGNVKLNTVVIRGVNDAEVEKLIAFANDRRLNIRFIEFMPNRYSAPGDPRFISRDEILGLLPYDMKALQDDASGAARYFGCPSLRIKVGFVSSVSRPFCGDCDRIRLTADGLLYTCLYNCDNINLFSLLADNADLARTEIERLLRSRQLSTRQRIDSTAALPSFCSIGG